jgi:hypothetical protein
MIEAAWAHYGNIAAIVGIVDGTSTILLWTPGTSAGVDLAGARHDGEQSTYQVALPAVVSGTVAGGHPPA